MARGITQLLLVVLGVFLAISESWASTNDRNHELRATKDTPCAFYLAPKENVTFGTQVTDTLSIEELKAWLATNPDISEDLALYAVGASFHRAEHRALMNEIHRLIEEHKKENPSFPGLDVHSIRRLGDFLSDQRGIYAINPDGTMEKLSAYNPNDSRVPPELKEKLETETRELVVVGAPLIGRQRKSLQKDLQEVSLGPVHIKSALAAAAAKAVKEPSRAPPHNVERIRYFFPMREDLQKPTQGELEAMKKKLIVPGVLTFAVQAGMGFPMSVVIPVTIVNAINSALTGAYRTFIGNWFRRSKTFFPSAWLKQLSLGAFFTADLYWAGAGAGIVKALSLAGWVNMFLQKWPTIIFNSLWRTPYHDLVYKWEAWRNRTHRSVDGNGETRQAAGSLEKFMSYLMTQFFIYSIITENSLFSLVKSMDGVYFKAGDLLSNEAVIMNFNLGHIAMAGVGAASLVLMLAPQVLEPAARLSLALERWESKLYGRMGAGMVRFVQSSIAPFRSFFTRSP